MFLFNFRPTSEPVRTRSNHVRHDTTKGRRRAYYYYYCYYTYNIILAPPPPSTSFRFLLIICSPSQTTTATTKTTTTTFGSWRSNNIMALTPVVVFALIAAIGLRRTAGAADRWTLAADWTATNGK